MTPENQTPLELAVAGPAGSVFRNLARLVYVGEGYGDLYQAICDAALAVVDGCDHASIMLIEHGRILTAAATDDVARHVDRLERQTDEGPCVDALKDEAAQLDADLTSESSWPGLRKRILAETPVRSMAGFRLLVDDRKAGALNVFSDTPGGLTVTSVDQAAILAAFASVGLAASSDRLEASTLRDGLQSNREIGKAVGLMMAFHKVSDQEAFDILRRASQEMNLKVSEVARQVVEHHNRRPTT